MATSTVSGFYDGVSQANFETWSKNGLSAALASFGWTQTTDTGQINWTAIVSSVPISAVINNGDTTATYTYDATSATGPVLAGGNSVITVTGFTNGANNISQTLISSTGGSGAASTFTVTNAAAVNETHAATGTTTYFQVGVALDLYEIWKMTDVLASSCPCVLRIDYLKNTSNQMEMAFQVGLGTNGQGIITLGNSLSHNYSAFGANDTTDTTNAYFSGSSNRLSLTMWARSGSAGSGGSIRFIFALERSHDSTGADTAEYLTYVGYGNSTSRQQCVFADGSFSVSETGGAMGVLPFTPSSAVFGTGTAVSPIFPMIGKLDNPMMGAVAGKTSDFTDLSTFSISIYGASHTYVPSLFVLTSFLAGQSSTSPCMRYD